MIPEPERVGEVETIEIENVSRETKEPPKRGFAAMTPERRREIAQAGGKAAQRVGGGHRFGSAEARAAGKKGGAAHSREHLATIGRRGGAAVSADREHMATIGRKGGKVLSADREHMAEIGQRGGAAVSADREHMATLGRKGGKVPRGKRRAEEDQ